MPDATSHPASALREVDVCVCTFQRPSIADLLASLAKLDLPTGWRMRVIVADNDDTPSARERVERAFAQHALEGRYVHAPARNISIARNACLDAASAPFAAFVDDDETVRPDWLARLIARAEREKAGVVFGKVEAAYAPDAPAWMAKADMHSTVAQFRDGEIEGGYTCNVLLRRSAIGSLRFNPAFGRSGGEDTGFFAELNRNGVSMVYEPEAVVDEPVPAGRSSLGWLTTRAFRSGQSYGLLLMQKGQTRPALFAKSLSKICFCIVVVIFTIWSPARWRRAAVRAHLHAGVLGAVMGKAPLELYGVARG